MCYCLDNDADRFKWADCIIPTANFKLSSSSFTGSLYRDSSKDESGYYAFSNGSTVRYTTTLSIVPGNASQSSSTSVTRTPSDMTVLYYKSGDTIQEWIYSHSISDIHEEKHTEGYGVIYRMIDEFGNDCPYDFKNIISNIHVQYPNDENFTARSEDATGYLFSTTNATSIYNPPQDASLLGYVIRVKIGAANDSQTCLKLPKIIFTNLSGGTSIARDIVIGEDCENILISASSNGIKFVEVAPRCYNIRLYGTDGLKLGNRCYNSYFQCSFCTILDNCHDLYIYSNISSCSLGQNCSFIAIPQLYCNNIKVDNGCSYICIKRPTSSVSPFSQLQNIYVYSGIKGTASEIKQLTVNSGLSYITEFKPSGSVIELV